MDTSKITPAPALPVIPPLPGGGTYRWDELRNTWVEVGPAAPAETPEPNSTTTTKD